MILPHDPEPGMAAASLEAARQDVSVLRVSVNRSHVNRMIGGFDVITRSPIRGNISVMFPQNNDA